MTIWRVMRYLVLLIFVSLALSVLFVRHLLLPGIDRYRPQIIDYVEQQIGLALELEHLSADWKSLNPNFSFIGLLIKDPQTQGVLLRIPQLEASLSWRSLFERKPLFRRLHTQGLQLDIRRDHAGTWWLLNQAIDFSDSGEDSPALGPLLHWLSLQRHVSISQSILRWQDQLREAPILELEHVNVELVNRSRRHQLAVTAVPPADLGQAFKLQFQAETESEIEDPTTWRPQMYKGRIYLSLQDIEPKAWKAWLPVPDLWQAGSVTLHASQDFSPGQWGNLNIELLLKQILLQKHGGLGRLAAGSLRLFSQAPLASYRHMLLDGPAHAAPLVFQAQGKHVFLSHADVSDAELELRLAHLEGQVWRDKQQAWRVQDASLRLSNQDLDARLHGSWRSDPATVAGRVDMRGSIEQFDLAKLVNYLPLSVEADARDWLHESLQAGRLYDGSLSLQGDIDYFPFGLNPEAGEFLLEGKFKNGLIDYLPANTTFMGWPRLESLSGQLEMRNARLRVHADQASMPLKSKTPIDLKEIHAEIDNLEYQSVLSVRGISQAPAASYIALFTQTPLGGMLDHLFDNAQGTGQWTVPLSLTVPLTHADDTQLQGELQFSSSAIKLMPEAPWLRDLQGSLLFSERGVAAKALTGQLLGGSVSVAGRMEPGTSGLRLEGQVHAENLGEYVDAQALRRLNGSLDYSSVMTLNENGHFGMELESNLVGVDSHFPAPMSKSAASAMPLKATWSSSEKGHQSWLDIRLQTEPVTQMRLLRQAGQETGSFFQAMSVLVDQQAPFPEAGTVVDGRYSTLDLDAWNKVLDEFDLPWEGSASVQAPAPARRLLPELVRSRVQVEHGQFLGVPLDHLTVSSQQQRDGNFRLDISSTQTAGTIWGRTVHRKPVGLWKLHFNRLRLGQKEKETDTRASQARQQFLDLDEHLVLPDIDVKIDRLSLYERDVGKVQVLGRALNQGRQWKLEKLQLEGSGLRLSGDGYWQLRGPHRGLHLSTHADIEDLGAYLKQLGIKDMLEAGKGKAEMTVFWQDFPWSVDRSTLQGHVGLQLHKGRFSSVGSRSARLLELISLQSMSRILSMEFNLRGLFKDGFPFDDWTGDLNLKAGKLSTQDYRISGPVGLIVLDGHLDLLNEIIDLQAQVLPKFDVSGAALAAGVVINPFLGVGTFLAQWLLQDPLSQGMALRYRVSGSIDNPAVDELTAKAAPQESPPVFIEP